MCTGGGVGWFGPLLVYGASWCVLKSHHTFTHQEISNNCVVISRFCQLLDRLVIKNLASKPSTVTTLLLQSLASPKRFVPTISARAKRSCFYVWKMESEIETESESDIFFNV